MELTAKDAHLPSRQRGQSFEDSIATFIKKTTILIHQEDIPDETLLEYAEDLAQALAETSTYLYWTRKYRDQKLAEGFERYPKPQYNSEAQVALARAHASAEVRLHELCKDLRDALRLRINLAKERKHNV